MERVGPVCPTPPHLESSSTVTPQRTTTATPLAIPQIPAPEATPKGANTSAAMARNEKAVCQQRLETLLPEVKRARAAVGDAVEARRITREALGRNWEKLKLEQRQRCARHEQERALELEREDMAIRDTEWKVKGLEDDYGTYKNQKAATEARLRGHTPTWSHNTGQSPGGGRPRAAPASPAFPGDSKDDPPHLKTMGAEFSELRKLCEFHPDMSVQEFADFKLYFDAKQAAAKRKDGMDQPGRARPSPESARNEGPPRNVRYDSHRVERHRRGKDS